MKKQRGDILTIMLVLMMAFTIFIMYLPNEVLYTDREKQQQDDKKFAADNLVFLNQVRSLIVACEAGLPRDETCVIEAVQSLEVNRNICEVPKNG